MESHGVEPEQIGSMVRAKARELFDVCDKQRKGFINEEDMQVIILRDRIEYMGHLAP